jgi:hypothetical protein
MFPAAPASKKIQVIFLHKYRYISHVRPPLHREIAINFLQTASWYTRLDEESQRHFAVLGRLLLSLIIKCVTEPARQPEILNEIRDIGGQFGEITSGLGLPLIDAVQAFIQHRDPIVTVTSAVMKKGETVQHPGKSAGVQELEIRGA